jgi:hypothetical protein
MIANSASRNRSRSTLSLYGNETVCATTCLPRVVAYARVIRSEAPDRRALEVVTRLGDSIVDVVHLAPPSTTRRLSRVVGCAALVLGIACLVVASVGFVRGLHTAADDDDAYATWTAMRRPAFAFRRHITTPTSDAIVFASAAASVGLLAFGLVRVAGARRVPLFRIGSAPRVELPIAEALMPSFPLIAAGEGGFVLHVAPRMDGELIDGHGRVTLADAVREAPLAPGVRGARALALDSAARVQLRIGRAVVTVAAVDPPRGSPQQVLSPGSGRFAAYLGGVLAAHIAVIALLDGMPVVDGIADEPDNGTPGHVAAVGLTGETPGPSTGRRERHDDEHSDTAAPGLALARSAAATDSAVPSPSMQLPAGSASAAAADARSAIEGARAAGVLGAMAELGSGFAANTDDLRNGFDDSAAGAAGLAAAEGGDGAGVFGQTRLAFGPDGWSGGSGYGCDDDCMGSHSGSSAWGTIGVGRYGTVGHGVAIGDGRVGLRARTGAICCVSTGDANAVGDYDKKLIARYVRRHLAQVQYCYERERLRRPDLAGDIDVEFAFTSDGNVQYAHATGFDDRVGSCVADVVTHIQFPPARNATPVVVHYPFMFRAR